MRFLLKDSMIRAILAGIVIGAMFAVSVPSDAQISPATRPHTHASGSSGGSTLSPVTLNVTGTIAAPSVAATGGAIPSAAITEAFLWKSGNAPVLNFIDATRTADNRIAEWSFGNAGNGVVSLRFINDAYNLAASALAITGGQAAGVTNIDLSTTGGTVSLTSAGSLSSTKACAANYTRVGPNFCRSTTNTLDAWADATACTNRTFTDALPADAKAVLLWIRWEALANNATGSRSNAVNFFPNAACTGGTDVFTSTFRIFEQAATAASTILGTSNFTYIIPLSGTNQISTTQTNAGGNGNSDITNAKAVGYFD